MEQVTIVGIDLAKRSFQLHGAQADGSVAFRGKLSREKLLDFLGSQPRCVVVMEACAGAHQWGREIGQLGHEVRLLPPIYVKPFVNRQSYQGTSLLAGCVRTHPFRDPRIRFTRYDRGARREEAPPPPGPSPGSACRSSTNSAMHPSRRPEANCCSISSADATRTVLPSSSIATLLILPFAVSRWLPIATVFRTKRKLSAKLRSVLSLDGSTNSLDPRMYAVEVRLVYRQNRQEKTLACLGLLGQHLSQGF